MRLRKRYLFGASMLAGAGLLLLKKKEPASTSHLKEYLSHLDEDLSPDADKDPDEVGLTKLDSIYRAEWQANGYPRSRKELEDLEK
ncbi:MULTISPECIES: hypothetical protein [Exiguobacterium]|uniref:Uncharacterized protein n=1 Tax=Exiguobacterium antarcticum TaxID=132920 RepID=A0ABT6R038_9BACL|nr:MULTISPECIES: hypothetical protein [Exiguobacterium]AFS70266.1 Hypothetical protein Eab7_1125 [Exiguobacterium antarcticum B7]MCT4779775.1 hypothetical protein [Exiguobacterium soli]MDI3234304.1 hypothetical protein [Exiguobacterium antarcticum]